MTAKRATKEPKERKPRTVVDETPKGLVKAIHAHIRYLDTFDIPDTSKLKSKRAQFVKLKDGKDADTKRFLDEQIAEIDGQLADLNSDLADDVGTVRTLLDNAVATLKTIKSRGLKYYGTPRATKKSK